MVEAVAAIILNKLAPDNSKDFADHQSIDQTLGIHTYLADPFCSWQRGSNENFNGLLRQYTPKKRRIETITDEELTAILNRLNHRPRKRLGFKKPHEVLHASSTCVAPRTYIRRCLNFEPYDAANRLA